MTEPPTKAACVDDASPLGDAEKPHDIIKGLVLVEDFLTKEEASEILQSICREAWNTDLKRRTQQYGFKYEYKSTNMLSPAAEIPPFLQTLRERIKSSDHVSDTATLDQVIVNEYQKGQGISAHIDNRTLFDDDIVSISLAVETYMCFAKGNSTVFVRLPPRSLLRMKGEARHEWTHMLHAHKLTTPRVSVTFRSTKKKEQD
jgi:alkylated DNA repair dioxygenase AlkB